MKRGEGGLLRSSVVPGVALLVACAALVFQAPQLATAVAQGCVAPGNDGPNPTLTGVVNTYYPATASAAAGATSISVGPRIAGASPAIAAGDLLLVIQMQDADISGTNAVTYGDGATGHGSTALNSTGLYEYVAATSAVVAGVVSVTGSGAGNGLLNNYDFSTTLTATHGFRTFQVIRVPQYSSATLGAGLTAASWNGALHAGGVLAVDVAGALNLNAQTVSVDQLGFKGALGVAQAGGADTGVDWVVASQRGNHGYKGEGIAGTPHFLYDAVANAQVTGAADGYPSGDAARGAPGNAGGGGTDSHPSANDQNTGGGGGSNAGQGGLGGNSWNTNQPVGGRGGAAFPAAPTRVVLGGGGGAGTRNNSSAFASSGGTGGGIVMVRTGSLTGTGTISADGGVGVTPVNDGGGGGGAGGSVVVTTNTGNVNALTLRANGANGTNAWPTGPTGAGNYHGPGGGGGGGVIITSPAIPPAQASVLGGIHGTTTVDAATYGSVSGDPGLVLTTTAAAIPGSSSGAECLPALTVTKITSTPNVTNTAGGATATYSITVSNAINTAAATGVSISDALPAGFTYASTGSVTLNGGATRPATVNPVVGDTNPIFGTFTIPGAGSVVITFTVNIAASVAPGTYNNPATATYLDPTRTGVGGTTSASYAGGGAERVTVHAPDMTIAKSHVDPFVRGTTATYTLTATNSGNVTTSGTVTVTDTLPAGLTPTGAAGPGWTCPAPVGQSVTCTRADALAGGSSYPAITATVTVLQSAANSVTNLATVSGGSQTNTTNDTASNLTNIVSQADIAVTKTVSNATPNQNTNVTFTVTATNNGPSDATGVQVTDLLPAGLTFVSAAPSAGTYTSGTGLWNIGAIANGANATLSIVATVTGTTAVTNTATKTAETETDPVAANNTASVTVTGQSADIAITKTVSNPTPNLGSQVTFTVTATNNGPSNATGIQVTDLLPAGLSFVTAVPSVGAYNSGTGVWTIAALANGANATLAITATVNTTAATTNTATKTAANLPDPVAANDSASATVTGQAADVAVTKIVSNSTPNFGANVTFTITATNNGPSNATGVQVTDLLPAGLTFVSAAPSVGTYVSGTGLWNIGALANGASATLSLVATVNTTASTTNTATKTAENQPDPVAGNNSASATVNPVSADIAITKAVDNTRPNQNTNVTFTITATNNGPSNATGVVVTDLLPAGLSFVSATPSGVTTYNSGTGAWTIGALANGANATLSIVATATGTTAVTNTATKTAETQPDPVAGNNTASVTVTGQAADIGITKIVDNATPTLGTNVTFTVTARNNGPNNATGVQVTDLLPAGLAFVSATPSAGTTYNSGTGVWNIGALANGASATLSIVATVNTTAPVTNTAAKTAEDQPDPVPGNNSAGATVTPVSADIAIGKTVDNPTGTFGSNVTFTITAKNNGPSNATGVQVTDLLPSGLTYVSHATAAGTYNPITGIWDIGAIANGATATLTVTATVTSVANQTNTATKTAEDQVDPVTSNNSASSTVSCCLADIAVTKTVSNPTPSFGSNVIFTVTAKNNGPAGASGLQLTDQLPAGLTYVSSAPSVGTYNSGSGVWNIGGLANGSTVTLIITATVNTLVPSTNTATKTAENEADNTPGDDMASATVTPVAADVAITKTVSNTTPNQNTNVTFTVTATNNGPSNASGVQVTDLLPAGLTFVSATPSGVTTYNPGTGLWNIGPLANGANATLSIVATVTGTNAVTNTATKTAQVEPDPVAGNNTASATVTGQAADIAVLKSVSNPTPNVGTNVIFLITATNNGPSNATGVEVTDTLPAGLTLVSATPSVGTYTSGTGIWHIGPLANGASATLSIVATVSTTSPITNTATRTAGNQPDPVAGNDTASATVTGQSADIGIAKSVDNPVPDFGTNVTFIVTATNNGPSNATGVQVTDVLPAGLTFVSATPSGVTTYNSGTGIWNIGALGNGASATLAIVATVNTTAPTTNTATKTAEVQPDAVPGNNSASATITPVAVADIAVAKTVSNPTPNLGTNVTFTITATDNGPNAATGVQVTDLLPAGLTFVSAAPTAGTYSSVTGVWNIGPLANGASATLSIVATVNTTSPVTNTATKTAEVEVDPNAANNSASATVTPVAADIAITKTVDNPTPNQNTNVTFTVIATNNGPSGATGVVVTDLLPAGLTFVSVATSVGTYSSVTGAWTIGALANGANGTLTLVATVTGTTLVTNTATKTAEVESDPVAGNNSASAIVTGQAADIAMFKTVSNPTPNLGTNVTFTITATNNGPSNATGVVVTDLLPAGLTFVSAAPSAGTYTSGTGVWTVGALANGASANLSIVATVNSTNAIINTATKTAENQTDPVSGNNAASATVTGQAADIAVTKAVSNTTPNLNTNVTFTVTVTNNGPSNATGVQVTDLLPAGLTFVSAAPSAGTYNAGTGLWDIGALANGANATLSIVATVTGTNPVTNIASKTAEVQPDPVAGNNLAMATVTGQSADIAITKVVDNATPALGSNVTFTVTATNNGPSSATGVVVTDLLPAGLTFVSAVPSVGTYNSATGVWNIGGLTNGFNAALTIVATVTTTSTATNTATKTGEVQPDPVSGNDSASAAVTGVSADINVTKTVNSTTPTVGQNVTYTLVANNLGPSTAPGVQFHDTLPAAVTLVSYTATQGTYNPATGIWNVGSMPNGTTVMLSIVVQVKSSGAIVNTVTTIGGSYFDPNLSNNVSSSAMVATALPGLPNTSAPEGASGGPAQGVPQKMTGLLVAILTAVAGLGVLGLAGLGRRQTRARFGRRRSRSSRHYSPGRLTIGLLAGLLSVVMVSISVDGIAQHASPTVASLAPGTQLIGSKAVAVDPPPAPAAETFSAASGPITPSRLRIPAIGIDAWIGAVGLRKDGSMDVPDNLWTSSWLAKGPRPGQAGNAVIAGHRGVGSPALFSHLENVQPGDKIYVSDAAGNQLAYVVTRVAVLDLSASTQVAVFGPTPGPQVVLITCFGRYVPSARTYDHRLVVFSSPLPL
ncbi:MAG TPA: sortase [Candidatus Dormibacteraeota bacterium]|nr:sortase [Candidatus Dormibacteraeota bacterium]